MGWIILIIIVVIVSIYLLDTRTDFFYNINKKKHLAEEDLFNSLLTLEIPKIEDEMKKRNISLPSPSEDKEKYFKSCLFYINYHFRNCIKGYELVIINPCNGMRVLFNKKKIFIITNNCCDFINPNFKLDKKNKKIIYYYTATENALQKDINITIEEIFSRFEKECNLEYIKANSNEISMSNLRWHVGGLDSNSYKLGGVAAGAVVGGLMFGAVGALGGAMKANSDQNKNEHPNRFIRFGANYSDDWIVSYSNGFNDTLKTLDKHFPDKREPDQYHK